MNIQQLYYARETLGIHSFIRPSRLRKVYKIYQNKNCFWQNKPLVYFSETMDKESRNIIQKINVALKQSHYIMIEIKNPEHPYIPFLLKNLSLRRQIKGFIVFGPALAQKLTNRWTDADNEAPGCVLSPIEDYKGNTPTVVKRKHKAWTRLAVFSQ